MYELNSLKKHDHAMFIYNSKYDRFTTLAAYIGNTVSNNNRVLTFIDSRTSTMLQYLIEYLELSSYDNCYSPVPVEEYLWNEKPNINEFLDKIRRETEATIEDGFEKLDIIIDMHYLTSTFIKGKAVFTFEKRLGELYNNLPVSGLCTYYYECLPYLWLKKLQLHHNKTIIADSLIFPAAASLQDPYADQYKSGELDEAVKNLLFQHLTLLNETIEGKSRPDEQHMGPQIPPRFLTKMRDIIWMFDASLKISYVSPSIKDLINAEPQSVVGLSIHDTMENNVVKEIYRHNSNGYLQSSFTITHSLMFKEKPGATVSTRFSPLTIGENIVGYIAVSRDITAGRANGKPAASIRFPASTRLVNYLLTEENGTNPAYRYSEGTITEREFEIINQLMQGLQNREIAENLHVAEITVKKHLSSIYKKLNIRNRVELFKTFRGT